MSGTLIVIDGTDGSGKATQAKLLVKKLIAQGYAVELMDFPQYGKPSATLVEEYLNGKFGTAKEVGAYRASILYAVDRYAAAKRMKEALAQGTIIISNRYVSSNMGHQAGKITDSKEREQFLNWVEDLEYNIFEIPKPDINILLHMPVEIGQQLVDQKELREYIGEKKRDMHEADKEHLLAAEKSYLDLVERYNWIKIGCAPEGNLRTREEIHTELWNTISPLLPRKVFKESPLQ